MSGLAENKKSWKSPPAPHEASTELSFDVT